MKRRGSTFVIAALCLVLAVTALAYLPSLGNGFTNWDDQNYVVANRGIRDLSPAKVRGFFSSFYLSNYHPLTLLSYALDYRLFGLDPRGYHAVNLLLHLANTSLVFLVARLLGGPVLASLAAALLFGVHPLHVESVAWVAERKDVLSTLFFLGALACWLRHRPGGRGRAFYWLALALLLLSLLSKSMGVTFPLVLVLCDRRFGLPSDRRAWMEKLPFFGLAALFALLALLSQGMGGGVRQAAAFPLRDNVFIASWGLLFYLVKAVLPLRLSALYPLPPGAGGGLPFLFLLAPVAAAAVLAAFRLAARRSRTVAFGGLFFLVTLLPVIQIFPLGYAAAADRYFYLPSLGLCLLAGLGVSRLAGLAGRTAWRPALGAAFACIVLAFAALTWQRTAVWKDSVTLWSDVLAKHPSSLAAYINRGEALVKLGRFEAAVGDFTRAIELQPGRATAYFNRGHARLQIGQASRDRATLDLARDDLERALALDPRLVEARRSLGQIRALAGDLPGALAELSMAVAAAPGDAAAHLLRGKVYRQMGSPREAIADLGAAIENSSGDAAAEPLYERGNAFLEAGDPAGAIEDYSRAIGLRPAYAPAYNNRGAARAARGETEPALEDFSRAIGIDPGYAGAYFNRGRLLERLGRGQAAAADLARAGELAATGRAAAP